MIAALLALVEIPAFAGGDDIILQPQDSIIFNNPDRTEMSLLSAALERNVLYLAFPSATASQVVIINEDTSQTVYSDSFASTTQVVIDLEDEGIGEGSYLIRIYAFDKWWWGEFVLEEERFR